MLLSAVLSPATDFTTAEEVWGSLLAGMAAVSHSGPLTKEPRTPLRLPRL